MTTGRESIRNFEVMDTIGHLIAAAAASPWALALVALVLVVDGFFPFVPGETLVVATSAAIGVAGGNPWLVPLVAVPAALAGDLIAYHLGRRFGLDRWASRRNGRIARAFALARRRLGTSPASILLTAKFVPVVRVVVSMTAGSVRMPLRRYLPLAVTSITLYTGLHVAVGALVGTAAGGILGNPLVALGVSLAVGLGIGALVDRVAKRLAARAERGSGEGAGTQSAVREPDPAPGQRIRHPELIGGLAVDRVGAL
ncbi:MAG: VTT domain-containing protein [Microbacteriaceae bacterium]|nr:VTT domain-containing protein [Microbacteriaceae bacterium]MCL2794681.1 VTT domain-containing protein [Microbacteriaceae bacterium]